ncbi:O-antigen ligase domain-containing protein [Photobacterium gaetbulicola]|uniref:O-antigen ligase-related domain-containing protein n=1 Tax=Photobacterium gaetbulicola Gung47 TaxID=658445 RepID=A0A0C5WWU3_9GAMM|nr:O-antigen ligase family protein [Photobacterium gaetbulicola]AJR09499.1 hypothetical protein H744_2c2846 [Photobacterium gaetbulicola Gung47]PSU14293.1 O-antigen ligase domain-containing protein [Photobacterium gaetbulicola]
MLFTLTRNIFLYCLIFIVLFLEPVSIGGVKFAILWKFIFFGYLLTLVLFYRRVPKDFFILLTLILALKNLLSFGAISAPLEPFMALIRMLTFPVIIAGFYVIVKSNQKSIDTLNSIIKHYPYFVSFSCLPFVIGVLEPISHQVDLESFGVESFMFTGVFQNPHSASINIAFAMLALICIILRDKRKLLIFNSFILIFLLYCLYKTYARTGLLVFILGCLPILWSYKLKARTYIAITLVSIMSFSYVATNDLLMDRLFDKRVNVSGDADFMQLGSGRPLIWKTSFFYYYDSSLDEIFLGVSETKLKENNLKELGLRIFSHNGFLDALAINGIVGLVLTITFFIVLKRRLYNIKNINLKLIGKCFFMGYLAYFVVQGGNYFTIDFLVSILILVGILERNEKRKENFNYGS